MDIKTKLSTIERQFLCCYSVSHINWQQIATNLTWDDQKYLLDQTYNHSLNKDYPISINYQLSFLKKLIHHLEQLSDEVHDEIYEAYCKLQSAGNVDEKFFYKHYSLPVYNTVITLKESKSFVADGTTGLCSWQASLALSDWLLQNGDIVRGKSVIELGAGTGLCGFIVSKGAKAKKVILTDGSPAVIDAINANRSLNFQNKGEEISIVRLPWNKCELVQNYEFDVILAADVIYDAKEFDDLVNAIDYLVRLMADQAKLILAATVRNEITLKKFLSLLQPKGFVIKVEEVVPLEKSHLFWDRSTPVKIMSVRRNTKSG